jgi:hypothetical protein
MAFPNLSFLLWGQGMLNQISRIGLGLEPFIIYPFINAFSYPLKFMNGLGTFPEDALGA